jgi:membrane-bound lytic murein transglycosylase D
MQSLDSLQRLEIFPVDKLNIISDTTLPSIPDLVYEVKIASIDNLSPISFDFNQHVKRYINIYTHERVEQVSQMLGLAELYFPLFDEILDKHQLPLELKYLAVVESALNPLAISSSGAVGLWQFKINSGRMFDLEVNSYIDERMDPEKSTEAACLYLKYLYRIFNDWHLVMASYNAGPGVVRNAIQRSGGETNFWKLYDHLPEAAQNYVPAFIAATYIMQNANDHGIRAISPSVTYYETDTVHVSEPLSFYSLSNETGIPLDLIRFLNPTYKKGFVPKLEKANVIRIPNSKIETFISKEKLIYEKSSEKSDYHVIFATSGNTENKILITHQVVAGDYLHKIAIKFNCTIDDLQIWNPELNGDLTIGQNVSIWIDKQTYSRLKESINGLN